jgi:hypothetical protein
MRNTAFDERYQDPERNHLTPLWGAESSITPPVPQPTLGAGGPVHHRRAECL